MLAATNRLQDYERVRAQIEQQRAPWIADWRDQCDYILPRAARFTADDVNRGGKRTSKILNSTATLAARTCAAGMVTSITSPARIWFSLSVPDPSIASNSNVKAWLYTVANRMRDVFTKSNLYNVLPAMFLDIAVFNTACMAVVDDEEDVIRCFRFPIGSYALANGPRQDVDTFARYYKRTARQLVTEFGIENCSPEVQNAHKSGGSKETWFPVVHYVGPNPDHDPSKLRAKFKPWVSCYYEPGQAANGKALQESGFDEFPIMAPRWQTDGDDVWGTGPGMDCIDDIKALQQLEKKKLRAVDKMVDPALIGPSSMQGTEVSMAPGGITFSDEREGIKGLRPLHEVNFRVDAVGAEIAKVEMRIERHFFADLFLLNSSINNGSTQPVTAEEIRARQEEKLLMLGPVDQRVVDELLEPLIDRTFSIMFRRGLIPPAPVELQGIRLRVECVSVLAAAQKLLGVGGVDRMMGVLGNMAATNPTSVDKVDFDQVLNFYGDALSTPPGIIRSDEAAQAIRQQRAQAADQQQAVENSATVAKGAQVLSMTDTRGDNALTDLLRQNTGTPP